MGRWRKIFVTSVELVGGRVFHLLFILPGCTEDPPVEPPPIPEETGLPATEWVDTGVFRPPDTASVGLGDDVPSDTITLEQTGTWNLSGDPYDALVGRFRMREFINGVILSTADTALPECDVTLALQGSRFDGPTGCPSCDHVWDVQFTQTPDSLTGDAGCHDPDRPRDGDTWRLGYSAASATIYFNFYGSGVWIPWWGAVSSGDSVVFEWTRELAIDLMEDEDQ